jgi:hypothetical protein
MVIAVGVVGDRDWSSWWIGIFRSFDRKERMGQTKGKRRGEDLMERGRGAGGSQKCSHDGESGGREDPLPLGRRRAQAACLLRFIL